MSLSLITLALTLRNILLNDSSSKIKHNIITVCSVHVSPPPPSEPCLACIIGVRRGNPDHHRSPLRSVTGDGLEYNLKTCIPERLANP
jgi:hypothetical protein